MIHCYTGNGKGKTSAALGVAFRSAGWGWNTCVIQFIKGNWDSGETEVAKNFTNIDVIPAGRGFYKILNDNLPKEEHLQAAQKALTIIRERILSGKYSLIILDEVNVAAHLGLISAEDIIKIIKKTPSGIHFILTGRHAPAEFIEIADLVTEMNEIKHPFQKGKTAEKGLDF